MTDIESYPLKYSNLIIQNKEDKILEAGCGAGRILRFYHNLGYDIKGIDLVGDVIKKLKKKIPL